MKNLIFIITLLIFSFYTKAQTYTSSRTVEWENGKIVDEKFNKVEIDVDKEKKLIYISWLDLNVLWQFNIIHSSENKELIGYTCKAGEGNNIDTVTIGYYKPDNQFVLTTERKKISFVFQNIKKK